MPRGVGPASKRGKCARAKGLGYIHSINARFPEPPFNLPSLAYANMRMMKAMGGVLCTSAFLQTQGPLWLKARTVDSLFTSNSYNGQGLFAYNNRS